MSETLCVCVCVGGGGGEAPSDAPTKTTTGQVHSDVTTGKTVDSGPRPLRPAMGLGSPFNGTLLADEPGWRAEDVAREAREVGGLFNAPRGQ